MPTIFFAINGTTVKQGSSPLNIAGTYTVGGETITIAPSGGLQPLIHADDVVDRLWMQNAVITSSTAPIDNVKLSFWMAFASLNTGTVTYSIEGSGNFIRSTNSSDPNDWISARGNVEGTVLGSGTPDNLASPPPNPPTCSKKLTSCATSSPATWAFNVNTPNGGFKVGHNFGSGGKASLPAGANDLKAEFWIHLQKTTDKLTITAAPGIRVKFGPPGGGRPTVSPNRNTKKKKKK